MSNKNTAGSNNINGIRLGSFYVTYPAVLFLALNLFVLFIAYPITKTKLLLLMGSLMLIFALACFLLTLLFPLGLSVVRKMSGTAMVDLSYLVSLTVTNIGLDKIGFTLYDYIPPMPKDNQLQELPVEYLAKGESKNLEYRIIPKVRGEFELNSVYIRGGDPFGLFQRYIAYSTQGNLVVLPKPIAINYQLPTSVSLIPFEEQSTVNLAGNSSEFLGVRDYQSGDSPKTIHWLASAKRGQLITRLYERNVAGSLSVILINNSQNDKRNPQTEHPLEYQIKLAANLAQTAVDQQYILQLATVSPESHTITRGTGQAALQEWLNILARLKNGGPFSIAHKVGETIAQLVPPIRSDQASLLIIISSGLIQKELRELSLISYRMKNTVIADIDRSSFSTEISNRNKQNLSIETSSIKNQGNRIEVFSIKSGDNLSKSASLMLQKARGAW